MARHVGPRSALAALAAGALAASILAVAIVARPTGGDPGPGSAARGGPDTDTNAEAVEQRQQISERTEAYQDAVRAGRAGQTRTANAAPVTGWVGERPFDTAADDWEPAIAADPKAPWVYALVTRYGTSKPCPGNCPTPYIAVGVSSDGGATWTEGAPLCACKGSGQFDPIIEVVPNTGQVYALYMNGFNVLFTKSTDHARTWSAPVATYGNVSWNDKPIIAESDDGRDVYVAFNGPTGGDPWIAQSHDFGASWSQRKVVDSSRYIFAFDGDVSPDGTVSFAETSLLYGGGGNKGTYPVGAIEEHVFISRDRGTTFEDHLVAQVQPGVACVADGCTPDYYLAHGALSADANGALVLLYDGATTTGGNQTIGARRSTDGGRTWSSAVTLSKAGEEATSPAVESRGAGDVRAWWMETAGGNPDAWNVWYRTSADGGATWAAPVRLSDAASGAGYKTAAGFMEVYGDYGELAITSTGKSIAIWGEGFSYTGPGGVWFNRQQ
ncbi:MAG TPA: sialidase family protein [Candidatus Limnocylindrales bacterium]